jgi:hypothetical protein
MCVIRVHLGWNLVFLTVKMVRELSSYMYHFWNTFIQVQPLTFNLKTLEMTNHRASINNLRAELSCQGFSNQHLSITFLMENKENWSGSLCWVKPKVVKPLSCDTWCETSVVTWRKKNLIGGYFKKWNTDHIKVGFRSLKQPH